MADDIKRDATGLEDVIRSVRVLARNARELVEDAGGVAEREVAMLLTVAEDMRDRLSSEKALEAGRAHPLFRALRSDAHRAVDLGFDFASTGYVVVRDTFESFLDRPRQTVSTGQIGTSATKG